MKRTKSLILLILTLMGIPSLVLMNTPLTANAEVNEEEIEGYPVSYVKDDNEFKNESLGYKFKIKNKYNISKYTGEVYRNNNENIVEITIEESAEKEPQKIRVIPVDASNSTSSLNLLERFILTEHGMREKTDQRTFKLGTYDISQIVFKFNVHGVNIINIFSAIKEGDEGWIITYLVEASESTEKILYNSKQTQVSELEDFIRGFQINKSKSPAKSKFRKLKETPEINSKLLEINKEFNMEFETTF